MAASLQPLPLRSLSIMATRRPQSSRARNAPPVQPMPRARSVMARPVATRTADDVASTSSTISKPARSAATPTPAQSQSSSEAEANIQVVIRCRRRSEREMESSSPVIVTSNGAKSNHVSIELTAPTSTLGLMNIPPTRTYPFDLVFGPEADQAMIYHEVVNPMLDQVLMGYNCTLFAYGQTGTGKTYTMHGDLTPTPMGNPSIHAGMIPRVLFRLFHYLETSGTDFNVKVSYIELYNEELRDLLAVDLPAPVGTAQPMAMSKDIGKMADGGGLKIFDDANKRGVYIQGVEEISVTDCADALGLLTKGSQRRQTASTKFNDHSSRSHSIFSITVHTKDSGVVGEDLLKIGKLNLVDLAGSENIGRSGAQNARAREAGMINQSLLTLGRVINALVEKAQHVPYRESKLTRLLQDSLGGRTKTCIVATVSPARCNMEETLSTLDYAMHAKSIRNKPELNQRMTRSSLLKEYVAEIERLKADVLAAREKNGIFFSEETWNQISTDQELLKTELDEAKKQVDIVESQLKAVRDEFDQSIGLLKKRETELKDTRQQLDRTTEDLSQKQVELNFVKRAFEEEVIFRQAFQETEEVLDDVAAGLKQVASEGIRDVGLLLNKLERKSKIMASNADAVSTHGKSISSAAKSLSRHLDEFVKLSATSTDKLCREAEQFGSSEVAALASHSKNLQSRIAQFSEFLSLIEVQDTLEHDALQVVQHVIQETHDTFKDGFGTWGATLSATCAELCLKVERSGSGAFSDAENALKLMGQVVDDVLRDVFKFIEGERQAILNVKTIASDASDAEIMRLRQQNDYLTQMLEKERANAQTAKNDLIQRISGMLGTFVVERDAALRSSIQTIQQDNKQGERSMRQSLNKQDDMLESMDTEGTSMTTMMEKRNGDVKRHRDGAFKALSSANSSLSSELSDMETAISGSVTTYSEEIQRHTQEMSEACSTNFEGHRSAKRIRLDTMDALASQVQSQYRVLGEAVASTSHNTKAFVNTVSSTAKDITKSVESFEDSATSHLSSTGVASKALSTEGLTTDVSTGTTPRKRPWKYVDVWDLTGSREDILKTWRGKGLSNVSSETFIAEHLPLPNETADDSQETDLSEPDENPVIPSSTTSQTSVPDSPPRFKLAPKGKGRNVLQTVPMAPLVDSRNVYMTRGSRRPR